MILRIVLGAALLLHLAGASVVRLDIRDRTTVRGGERLAGKAFFAIDPRLPQNRVIADIEYAPRNPRGNVEFSSDFVILRPVDPHTTNGTVLVEIVNRGNKLLPGFFDGARGASDNFLLDHGFTLVWIGWQWDIPKNPGLVRLNPVIATDHGKPITGLVRAEFTPDHAVNTFSLGDRTMIPYAATAQDDAALTLTVRDRVEAPRRPLPRSSWQFTPDRTAVTSAAGFEPGHIYELVYRAENPVIAGLGPAAVRDIVAYLKHDAPEHHITRAIGFGVSQSGRLLRSFVYEGFNEDEQGRKVFDGILSHVAGGGRGAFNQRFAQASRDAQPIANTFYPVDIFPFTDLDETDPETGATDGLLRRAAKSRTIPKIFYTNSTYEYYGRAASLIHTTPDGRRDAPVAPDTRIYIFAGSQHGPAAFPPQRGQAQFPQNPNDFRWSMRALLLAMQNWISTGAEPPASQYPTIAAGTLVAPEAVRFPDIPGVKFPRFVHKAYRADYGPDFANKGIVTIEPPKIGAAFPILVPQVDADGNELGCIRLPEHAVPLATYTGWNLREPAVGAPGELASLVGSWLPFPPAKIAARYTNRAAYLERVSAAARALAASRYLLEADLPRVVEHSAAEWDYAASR